MGIHTDAQDQGQETACTVNDEIKPYLDEISERLLTGHATLMIGAGFSKNAAPLTGSNNQFPNWNELGEIFFEKVYGKKVGDQNKFLNPLKLAEEVEVLFGRSVLNKLLTDNIPDNSHKPTELYTKLLQLEWRDVFTTNFDTLLERAADDIDDDRTYQVVVKKEDIVSSKSPRIFKLHGSFPSHIPFIVTEEDYRTYPQVFAPFVNTVHQALLETTLCLIGFSGDDPNFLKWIGWIRDQFEENATSKIYLIGSVDLSESQKKFLNKRNINIVDLGKCLEVDGDHAKAIEHFVNYLESKKTSEYRLDWPNQISYPKFDSENKNLELANTVENWKKVRKIFPGWRIVPKENRKIFHPYSQQFGWIKYITENSQELDLVLIQYVYEYCWQLEKSLLPILDDLAGLAEICLAQYQPITVANLSDSDVQNFSVSTTAIEQWIQISIYMLRYYREEGLSEKWSECETKLVSVWNQLSEEQVALVHYERALQQLYQLDISGLEERINAWPPNPSLPFIEAKRAGLLAEIGRLEDAQKILETSLKSVRKKQNLIPVSNDYTDVSDEAYLMLLLRCVKQSLQVSTGNYSEYTSIRKEYTERFNYLHQFKCSPLEELSHFAIKLDSRYSEFKQSSQEYSFCIGELIFKNHLQGHDYEALEAYSFLKFCEEIGLPFRLPGLDIAVKSAKGSLDRIGYYSPHLALITLIRVGSDKVVKQIYNRKYVYRMSSEQCDSVIDLLLSTLGVVKKQISTETSFYPVGFGAKLAKVLPIIFSRMCCKASNISKQKLLEFIVEVYSSEHKSKYGGIFELVNLLFDSMSKELQIRAIPKLLDIPIPINLDPRTERNFSNPFHCLRRYNVPISNRKTIPNNRITYYINRVKSKDQKVRDWAIYTLGFLSECNLLTDGQKYRFINAAWSQTDSYGFPRNEFYLKNFWLHFQYHKTSDIRRQVEKYVSELEIPLQSESPDKGITIGARRFEAIAKELIGAQRSMNFDQHVYELWLAKTQLWWECDRKYLRHQDQEIVEEFRGRFTFLISIMSEFILPNLTTISNSGKGEIDLLISDLHSYGMPTARIKVASIKLLGHNVEEIVLDLRKQLANSSRDAFHDAIQAVLFALKNESFDVEVQRNLISIVLYAIIWRANGVISYALDAVSQVVNDYPKLIDLEIEKMVLLALNTNAKNSDLENDINSMELEEKLNVRRSSAHLAYSFYSYYENKKQEIPQELIEWKCICESPNEFAEVRLQWDIS